MTHYEDIKKKYENFLLTRNWPSYPLTVLDNPTPVWLHLWEKKTLKRFFVTPQTTRKHANLSADSRVALLINSSMNVDADFHEAVSVTALGNAEEISSAEKVDVLKRYLAKHPYLEAFANAPTCALIGVKIISYVLVKNFQYVMELIIDQ